MNFSTLKLNCVQILDIINNTFLRHKNKQRGGAATWGLIIFLIIGFYYILSRVVWCSNAGDKQERNSLTIYNPGQLIGEHQSAAVKDYKSCNKQTKDSSQSPVAAGEN